MPTHKTGGWNLYDIKGLGSGLVLTTTKISDSVSVSIFNDLNITETRFKKYMYIQFLDYVSKVSLKKKQVK